MLWIVEQWWQLDSGASAPIRSVVVADTEEAALLGGPKAIKDRVIQMAGRIVGSPRTEVKVLHLVK